MELSTLVKMSNTYGSNPAYVLAGGGNTSVKDDTTLYVINFFTHVHSYLLCYSNSIALFHWSVHPEPSKKFLFFRKIFL